MSSSHNLPAAMLLLACMVLLPSSTAQARGLLSTSMEVEIGRWVRDDIFQEYSEWEDEHDNAMVEALGRTLAGVAEQRTGIEYEFYLLDTGEVNAFAAPGGFIFVTRGLLDFIDRDPGMLAGVLGHEIGHVACRHHRDAIEESLYGSFGLAILLDVLDVNEEWVEVAGAVALLLMQQGHSREDEYEADRQGVLLGYRAGWDPEDGIILFLHELEKEHGDDDLGDLGDILASHPDTDRRVLFAGEYLVELQGTEPFILQPFPKFSEPEEDDEKPARSDRMHVLWEEGD